MSGTGGGLDDIGHLLPRGTAESWVKVAPILPEGAYLAGGTALTVHLRHRISRDLDFFVDRRFDVERVLADLRSVGDFTVTSDGDQTLNGILDATKLQILGASAQRNLVDPAEFEGIPIASVKDILAMKLKVIGDRGEMRDYFDIMTIEQRTALTVEEGLGLFVDRYQPRAPEAACGHIVRGLAYLGDVEDDPGLPVPSAVVRSHWHDRVRRFNF